MVKAYEALLELLRRIAIESGEEEGENCGEVLLYGSTIPVSEAYTNTIPDLHVARDDYSLQNIKAVQLGSRLPCKQLLKNSQYRFDLVVCHDLCATSGNN